MKKTFISTALAICLAFAAQASAVLTLDSAVLQEVSYDGTSSYTGNFSTLTNGNAHTTLLLVIDMETLDSVKSSLTNSGSPLATYGTETGTDVPGLGVRSFGANNKTPIGIDYKADGTVGTNTGSYFLSNYTSQGKVVMALTINGTTEVLYLTNGTAEVHWTTGNATTQDATYNSLTIADNAFTAAISSIYVFDQTLTQEQIKSISAEAITAAVPEPATATLSLLALAGLAARRRRK